LCAWLEIEGLLPVLEVARETATDQDIEPVLELAGVSVEEYQTARDDLGWEKLRFSQTEHRYATVARWIRAVLRTAAARHAESDLAVAGETLAGLFDDRCPDSLAWLPCDEPELISRLAAQVAASLRPAAGRGTSQHWEGLIETWTGSPPREFRSLSTADVPRRDVDEYRTSTEEQRSSAARELVADILRLATRLATLSEETIDLDAIRGQPRIASLTDGSWANRFSVLPALRDALVRAAPATAKRLTGARVFRDPRSYAELAGRFAELADADAADVATRPEPTYTILDEVGTQSELETELAKGNAGSIGGSLAGFASKVGDLGDMIVASRAPLPPAQRRNRGTGQSRSGRRSAQDPIAAAQTGLLGEVFVYELLRSRLPSFGAPNWVSTNRQRYGLTEGGDDGLGYDFRYVDIDGFLTRRPEEPECLIEVKATEGERGGAFPMSESEWQRAVEAHQRSGHEVYIIFCVSSARDNPAIHDVLYDPVKLWHDGQLRFAEKDLWVRASPRT
jgi:hypothetical protein